MMRTQIQFDEMVSNTDILKVCVLSRLADASFEYTLQKRLFLRLLDIARLKVTYIWAQKFELYSLI